MAVVLLIEFIKSWFKAIIFFFKQSLHQKAALISNPIAGDDFSQAGSHHPAC